MVLSDLKYYGIIVVRVTVCRKKGHRLQGIPIQNSMKRMRRITIIVKHQYGIVESYRKPAMIEISYFCHDI